MNKTATQRAMEDRRDVDKFSRKYSAYISESKQYRRRVPEPMMVDDLRAMYQQNYFTNVYDEPFVELHMPVASFEHIMSVSEMEEQNAYKVQHAMDVLKQARADERVRDDNPAVQKAWRNYLMLLELARK